MVDKKAVKKTKARKRPASKSPTSTKKPTKAKKLAKKKVKPAEEQDDMFPAAMRLGDL